MEKAIDAMQEVLRCLSKAKLAHYPPEVVEKARKTMYGLALKFGPKRDRFPPDGDITAKFLSLAPWPRLERLLQDLMIERRAVGESDRWFLAVAVQRLHGVQLSAVFDYRDRLTLAVARPPAPPTPLVQGGLDFPAPDSAEAAEGREFAAGLVGQLRAKGMK